MTKKLSPDSLNWEGTLAEISLRDAFGNFLNELGQKNAHFVVLDADVSSSTKTSIFTKSFPHRFYSVGIAEQNMVGIATGFALAGKIPVVSGFTCFTLGRSWEFIRNAASDNLPLKICTTHSGFSAELDGGTHQSLEDIALMGSLPNMMIYCPADPIELQYIMANMLNHNGPCYIRLMRNKLPWVWQSNKKFSSDIIEPIYISRNEIPVITCLSTGSMTAFAPLIITALNKLSISCNWVHIGKLKPSNCRSLLASIEHAHAIVTIEEHNIINGFGAMITRIIAQEKAIPVLNLGIEDKFGQTGTSSELYLEYKLDPPSLARKITTWLKKINK